MKKFSPKAIKEYVGFASKHTEENNGLCSIKVRKRNNLVKGMTV